MEIITHRIDWKPTILVPISDVQYGSTACSSDKFRRWINRLLDAYSSDEYQLLFLGLGDYTDSIRPSMRRKYKQSGVDEDEHFETGLLELLEDHQEGFLKLVEGTEGKWIGMLEGHHYFDYGNGVTSDTKLADRLETTFLGDCTRIHLLFEKQNPSRARVDFQIWAHHGK